MQCVTKTPPAARYRQVVLANCQSSPSDSTPPLVLWDLVVVATMEHPSTSCCCCCNRPPAIALIQKWADERRIAHTLSCGIRYAYTRRPITGRYTDPTSHNNITSRTAFGAGADTHALHVNVAYYAMVRSENASSQSLTLLLRVAAAAAAAAAIFSWSSCGRWPRGFANGVIERQIMDAGVERVDRTLWNI